MKKTLIFMTFCLLIMPYFVFSDTITLKVGYFVPRGQSDLWETEFENMDFRLSDYNGATFGFTYDYFVSNELSISANIDAYSRRHMGIYIDYSAISDTEGFYYAFFNEPGDLIAHSYTVSITPIQLSVKIAPLGRKERLIPYFGGGVGVYIWNVTLQGEMVDFRPEVEQEFDDGTIGHPIDEVFAEEGRKATVGFQAFGGIMVPVGRRISVEAEFKYNYASGALQEGFKGFEDFDLNGYQFSIGMNYWF